MCFGVAEQPGKPWLQLMGKGQVLQAFTEKLALPAVTWEAMQEKNPAVGTHQPLLWLQQDSVTT